jgi:hypothetical protein
MQHSAARVWATARSFWRPGMALDSRSFLARSASMRAVSHLHLRGADGGLGLAQAQVEVRGVELRR